MQSISKSLVKLKWNVCYKSQLYSLKKKEKIELGQIGILLTFIMGNTGYIILKIFAVIVLEIDNIGVIALIRSIK